MINVWETFVLKTHEQETRTRKTDIWSFKSQFVRKKLLDNYVVKSLLVRPFLETVKTETKWSTKKTRFSKDISLFIISNILHHRLIEEDCLRCPLFTSVSSNLLKNLKNIVKEIQLIVPLES